MKPKTCKATRRSVAMFARTISMAYCPPLHSSHRRLSSRLESTSSLSLSGTRGSRCRWGPGCQHPPTNERPTPPADTERRLLGRRTSEATPIRLPGGGQTTRPRHHRRRRRLQLASPPLCDERRRHKLRQLRRRRERRSYSAASVAATDCDNCVAIKTKIEKQKNTNPS